MKTIVLALLVGVALGMPADPPPPPRYSNGGAFLNIQVQTVGSDFGTSVSKQQVVKRGPNGEEVEPFVDHQPPFLALPPVRPYNPSLPQRGYAAAPPPPHPHPAHPAKVVKKRKTNKQNKKSPSKKSN